MSRIVESARVISFASVILFVIFTLVIEAHQANIWHSF